MSQPAIKRSGLLNREAASAPKRQRLDSKLLSRDASPIAVAEENDSLNKDAPASALLPLRLSNTQIQVPEPSAVIPKPISQIPVFEATMPSTSSLSSAAPAPISLSARSPFKSTAHITSRMPVASIGSVKWVGSEKKVLPGPPRDNLAPMDGVARKDLVSHFSNPTKASVAVVCLNARDSWRCVSIASF